MKRPSGSLNHTFLSKTFGRCPFFDKTYAIFAPPYNVALIADDVENKAPIATSVKPISPKMALQLQREHTLLIL